MTGFLAGVLAAAVVVVLGRPPPRARLSAPSTQRSGVAVSVAVLVGTAFVALRLPVAGGAGIGLAVLASHRVAVSRRTARERNARSAAVAELTAALAGELRAGRTPAQALAAAASTAGPMSPVVAAAAAAGSRGEDVGALLLEAAELPGADRLRWTAAAWSVAESAGGRVAGVLDRVAVAIDEEDELRQELEAALAAPRATMLLLAALPVFGIAIGESIGAHPATLLLHRPLGWALLGVAVLLELAGLALTRWVAGLALQE
jgi:tight adherence protein B